MLGNGEPFPVVPGCKIEMGHCLIFEQPKHVLFICGEAAAGESLYASDLWREPVLNAANASEDFAVIRVVKYRLVKFGKRCNGFHGERICGDAFGTDRFPAFTARRIPDRGRHGLSVPANYGLFADFSGFRREDCLERGVLG